MTRLIAISGGIGAGKSVVSHILMAMGYEVYDTDSQAKRLMDNDPLIKQRLRLEISPAAVSDAGIIDRHHISSIVFADPHKLKRLNSIVHGAVISDIKRWCSKHHKHNTIFVETALLYQSGIDRIVDEVWDVIAPDDLRIERVMSRNHCIRDEVAARIDAQKFVPQSPHSNTHTIINDNTKAILPQILQQLRHESNS